MTKRAKIHFKSHIGSANCYSHNKAGSQQALGNIAPLLL